jgi:MFS family permease
MTPAGAQAKASSGVSQLNPEAVPVPSAPPASRRRDAREWFERNVAAGSIAVFLMGFGEELWKRFIPKYLAALGAPPAAIGLYGSARDFADGMLQYPGGWVADHYGRRRALQLFVSLAAVGYVLYLVAPSWPVVVVGLAFVMAWSSAASPTMFAVIGDALAAERRTMGFAVQSLLRRVPMMIAPALGGVMIASLGTRAGVRLGLAIAIAMAVVAFFGVSRIDLPRITHGETVRIGGVWRAVPPPLRRLLSSDVLVRTCEALADVFVVLFAIDVIGITAPQFGVLVTIQMVTSIAVYIPAARIARRYGRKPFVIATFVAFAMFPLAVAASSGFASLMLAFVIGGLREIGEPARKAMIVDLAEPHVRARTVGLYYLLRSLAISPAALIGGILWSIRPTLPFALAGAFGLAGAAVFALTVRAEDAA